MANLAMSIRDDDEISLTSTLSEQYTSDQEFGVDRILAEKVLRGKKVYLLLWENYPEEKSTWEPAHHIDPGVLVAWSERKKLEQENPSECFNVPKLEAKLKQLAKEKADRHLRRRAKRKRLGIPVSTSGSDADKADDSDSSIGAVERDEIDDAPTAKASLRRKSASPKEGVNKPSRVSAAGRTTGQRGPESPSSAGSTLHKNSIPSDSLTNRTLGRARGSQYMKSKHTGSRALDMGNGQERHSRSMSNSSLDIPLAKQRKLLQRPSSSSSNEPLESGRPRPNAASGTPSITAGQKQGPPTEQPLASTAVPRGSSSLRGVSSTRGGRAATRGASTIHKNVFAMGSSAASRSTRGNLLANAADTTKTPRQFSNKRLERKAQIQAREKADAAPDISALGGLYNPSTLTSVDPIRPGDLHRSSKNDVPRVDGSFVDTDTNSHGRKNVGPPAPLQPVPKYQQPSSFMTTCYYWDKQQRNSNAPPCMLGAACRYIHAYREGAPIAPAPVERSNFSSSEQPRTSTCFFWDKAEKDKSQSGCSKGDDCSYLHEYRPGVPVAPPPSGFLSHASSSSNSMLPPGPVAQVNDDCSTGVVSSPVSMSRGPLQSTRMSTCYYWDKQQSGESMFPCSKGEDCSYIHEYKQGVPIAGHPSRKESRPPASSSNSVPLPDHWSPDRTIWPNESLSMSRDPSGASPLSSSSRPPWQGDSLSSDITQASSLPSQTSSRHGLSSQAEQFAAQVSSGRTPVVPRPQVVDRPPWDPEHPHNAICYFWYNGNCKYTTDTCKFYHSNDKRLPLAPHPDSGVSQTPLKEPPQFGAEHPARTAFREDLTTISPKKRPPWNPSRPNDAICFFFWTRSGDCSWGTSCKFHHTYDEHFPIAPAPGSQNRLCRDWLSYGECRNPGCRKLHEPLGSEPLPKETSLLPFHTDLAVEPVREVRTKSVKFADERPAAVLEDNRQLCRFWKYSSCKYGTSCRNQHGDPLVNTTEGFTATSGLNQPLIAHRPVPDSRTADAMDLEPFNEQEQGSLPQQTPSHGQSTVHNQSAASSTGAPALPTEQRLPDAGKVKRNKINMEDYRRKKMMIGLGPRGKEVTFGSNETKSFLLDFSGIDVAKPSEWRETWEKASKITFTQMCMVQDFQAQQGFFKRRGLQEVPGNLVSGDPNDAATTKALNTAADELVLRSAGLVSTLTNFAFDIGVLVYPAKKEEWKFLEGSSEYPDEIRLRYFIFQCDSDVSRFFSNESNNLSMGQPYRMTMAERLHGIQLTTLLPPCQKGQNPYNFFLLFPATAKQSEDFIAAWIKAANPKSKIHSSRNDGAWKFFANPTTVDAGVVLTHESAAVELSQLPFLFSVINNSKRAISFWCVSDSDTPYHMYPSRYLPETLEIGRISTTRLFPRGCAFFLTPSFLVAEPQKAYDLFRWFLAPPKPKYTTTTPRSWKLVCCHKLSDYLLDVAIAKVVEKEDFEAKYHDKPAKDAMLKERGLSYDNCELRFKLHSMLAMLDNQGLLEPSFDLEEVGFESDTSEDTERPFVYADRSIDPDDEPALIKWFAGWTIRKLDRFKKFVIIGTDAKSALRAMRTIEVAIKKPALKVNFSPFKVAAAQTTETAQTGSSAKEKALAVAAKYKAQAPAVPMPQSTPLQSNITMTPFPRHRNEDTVMENGIEQGQNEILSPETVEFIGLTRGTVDDATKFLQIAQNNVPYAVQLYNLDEAVGELISTEGKPQQSRNPGLNAHDTIPQYDGADERPTSSGSNASRISRSGITTGDNGQRFVPRSVGLADNSMRREIVARPGYTPEEDKEIYHHLDSQEGSVHNSRRGSTAMDIDSGPDALAGSERERARSMKLKGRWEEQPGTEKKEITYPATTEWYKQLSEKRGYAWEHIYLGAWRNLSSTLDLQSDLDGRIESGFGSFLLAFLSIVAVSEEFAGRILGREE